MNSIRVHIGDIVISEELGETGYPPACLVRMRS